MDNIEQIFHAQEVMKQLEEDYKGKSVREIIELRFGAPIEKEDKKKHEMLEVKTMLKIEEIKPLYICEYHESDSGFKCPDDGKECHIDCRYTSNSFHAENPESVNIFEKFCDTFDVYVDDLGRLVCYEKEKDD